VAEPNRLVLDVQIRTIVKIAAAIALLWCLWKLSALILLLIVAVILAVTLDEQLPRETISEDAALTQSSRAS
jgi:hypothetical protein